MRCLIMVKTEAFSLQFYCQPSSFTGTILVFFVLLIEETPILGNIFGGRLHFMLIVKNINRLKNPQRIELIKKLKLTNNSFVSNNVLGCFRNKT